PMFPAAPAPVATDDPNHKPGQEWGPWYAIGPFAYGAGPGNMGETTVIERYLASMKAGAPQAKLDREHRGKLGAMTWRQVPGLGQPLALDVGTIDLNAALKPEGAPGDWNAKSCAYLYRVLEMDEAGEMALQLGSDDGLRLWLNGQLLLESAVARSLNTSDDGVTLQLAPGTNHILAKVVNDGGAWAFGMQAWDSVDKQAVNEAIDRGVKFLIERQYADGSWGNHPEYGAGHTAYAVYTLLKCGVPGSHPVIQRAMGFVRSRPADHTYSLSCRILALCALMADRDLELLAGDVERLVDFQSGSGLVGYPIHPNGSALPDDLSTTLYAVLAFHAAGERGVAVPTRTWRRLVLGALQCLGQEDTWDHPLRGRIKTAAFSYRPQSGYRGSMTSAGITILHLAGEALGDKLETHLKRKADAGIAGGLAWIERNMTWSKNPGGGHHYFHIYGMERLGSLLRKRIVGGVDWYDTGAGYLLRSQQAEGGWYGDNTLVDTLLALLFLERATSPSTGGKRNPDERLHLAESAETGAHFRVLAKSPTVVFLTGFGSKTLAEFEWSGERGRGPRVAFAEFLVKQPGEAEAQVRERVEVDATRPLGVQRIDAQLELEKTGKHEFSMRLGLLREPEREGYVPEQVVVNSAVVAVSLEGAFPPAALEYAADRDLCLLDRAQASFAASSKFGGGYEAAQAFDGLHSTRWECAATDGAPTLSIKLRRSTRAGRMLLCHAWPRLHEKALARVKRFEVVVNGRDTYQVEMDPHVLRKTELRFAKPVKVREIELRILEAIDGAVGANKLGFSEVQLLK
ncbi:MAG: prenyltransferase/squalene oxidase repeat-containing protein, partial [Planctomycetota bacterium]|nr:prenyltransferase/squalene oxidase repeat-containing protein [Planctomycetota bacterium]